MLYSLPPRFLRHTLVAAVGAVCLMGCCSRSREGIPPRAVAETFVLDLSAPWRRRALEIVAWEERNGLPLGGGAVEIAGEMAHPREYRVSLRLNPDGTFVEKSRGWLDVSPVLVIRPNGISGLLDRPVTVFIDDVDVVREGFWHRASGTVEFWVTRDTYLPHMTPYRERHALLDGSRIVLATHEHVGRVILRPDNLR